MSEITPQQHRANLVRLVNMGEWDDGLHQRFHQSHWYDWTCPTVDRHIKFLDGNKPGRIMGANQTYAQLIQALVNHIDKAAETRGQK